MHTTDPTQLTNESIRNKVDHTSDPDLNSVPDLIGFSRKVSATGLSSLHEPKLHEHCKLPPQDKEIWDQSDFEEYMGLHEETQTWEYISKDEYKALRPA